MKLEPNKMRVFQAILHLLMQARARERKLTQYTIGKALFLADRMHLNRFGRPITFDNYVAMDHGPVPSFCYNLLKAEANLRSIGIETLPWKRMPAPEISKNAYTYQLSIEKIDTDELSESDLEALSEALTVVSSLGFKQLKKLTHEDPAYEDAWENEGGRRSYQMSYGLLFDVPDFVRAEDLAFASKHS